MSESPAPPEVPVSDGAVARWRTHGRARRLGYALLPGETFSYILHLRPREWPIMTAHTALGVVLATLLGGGAPRVASDIVAAGVLAVIIWVALLNGGTLAINSAYDRDEDDVGYLDAPPPPPRHLAAFSLGLLVLGQALAFTLPVAFAALYAVCFAMSVLYSVPPVRLKAVAGADWVINIVGFGTLTPLAGWVATGRPVSAAALWIFVGFGALFAALYPLTQLYQLEEDRARGDRTLAIALGMRASLAVSIAAALLAFVAFVIGLRSAGVPLARVAVVAPALALWLIVLGRWFAHCELMARAAHQRGMYAALAAWAVTDIAIVAAAWA